MRSLIRTLTVTATFFTAGACWATSADTVFTDAKAYTVNEKQPWAEAVAIKDNKIVFVGSAADAEAVIGDGTEVFDLDGKMVLPGFVSGHDHLIASRWMNYGVNLYSAKSKEEYLSLIKREQRSNLDRLGHC